MIHDGPLWVDCGSSCRLAVIQNAFVGYYFVISFEEISFEDSFRPTTKTPAVRMTIKKWEICPSRKAEQPPSAAQYKGAKTMYVSWLLN